METNTEQEKIKAARKELQKIAAFSKFLTSKGVEVQPQLIAEYLGIDLPKLLNEIFLPSSNE